MISNGKIHCDLGPVHPEIVRVLRDFRKLNPGLENEDFAWALAAMLCDRRGVEVFETYLIQVIRFRDFERFNRYPRLHRLIRYVFKSVDRPMPFLEFIESRNGHTVPETPHVEARPQLVR